MLRFISIVSSDFWPGFAALVQSLAENSGFHPEEYEIHVICDPKQAPREWLATRRERISLLPSNDLPKIDLLSPQSQGRRMEQALQKLGVFALPESWGTCVYIDSDMICINPIRDLAELCPLSAACDYFAGFGGDTSLSAGENTDINTGLMVFAPSPSIFSELKSVYRRRHSERAHKGDQDIINMWIQETGRPLHRLGSEWNFSKRLQDTTGSRWVRKNLGKIRILHFVGAKPWTPNSEIDTFRECGYRRMEEMWWDYFERSGIGEHLDAPLDRSAAFYRKWVLPWSKPNIVAEWFTRAGKRLSIRGLQVRDDVS